MKKVSLTIASFLIAGVLYSQDYNPPAAAKTSLKTKYPTAVVEEWFEDEGEIGVYFENSGAYGTSYFSMKGVWISSEFNITEEMLPEAVTNVLKTKYNGFDATDVTKREEVSKTFFEIYIYNPITSQDYFITVDQSGKVIKEEDLNAE